LDGVGFLHIFDLHLHHTEYWHSLSLTLWVSRAGAIAFWQRALAATSPSTLRQAGES
jgi:hypothetical protein